MTTAPGTMVESRAARQDRWRATGRMYLGVMLPEPLFRRLMEETWRRGMDVEEGVARALTEGWLAGGPVIDTQSSQPAPTLRALPDGDVKPEAVQRRHGRRSS
jgi:hypothetical protein